MHAPVNAIAHAGNKLSGRRRTLAPECRTKSESGGPASFYKASEKLRAVPSQPERKAVRRNKARANDSIARETYECEHQTEHCKPFAPPPILRGVY